MFNNNRGIKYIKMGRKAKYNDTTLASGHGRKAKKQGDPTFPKGVLGMQRNLFIHIHIP